MTDLAERATSTELIRRSYDFEDFELRDDGDGGLTFEGVASVVDHPYPVRDRWGEYTEIIRAGAFDKTLKERGKAVSLYVNHRHTDVPLATRGAGTLEITADPNLRVKANLDPARPDVQIVASAIRRGEMRQMSIGFMAIPARDSWNETRTEVTRTEVGLRETSIVEAGANTGGTDAKVRAFADFMESLTDVEMTEDEIRRAISHLNHRFDDLFADDVRTMLRSALTTRYQPGDGRYVWVRDFTDNTVIFEREGFTPSGTFSLGFTRNNGTIELDSAEPTPVAPVTSYVPVTAGSRSSNIAELVNEFAERDRQDRERLERKRLIRA